MTNEIDGTSLRYNTGKIKMSNIPPSVLMHLMEYESNLPVYAIALLGEHYTLAEAKYPNAEANNGHSFPNWAKGQLFESFLIDSALRHYYAYLNGEIVDEDFGSQHLIAIAWCGCALHHMFSNYELYKEYDDRKWVGFKFSYVATIRALDNYTILIGEALSKLQVQDDINDCINLSFALIINALKLAQHHIYIDNNVNFKVSQERLNKIMNTDYGQANTSAKTKTSN